jgi:hypothetical protein
MNARIFPNGLERESERARFPKGRIPWLFAFAGCLYCAMACGALLRAIPILAVLLQGLGVQPPLLARVLIASSWWILPMFFLGSSVLTMAKQFANFKGRPRGLVNLFLVLSPWFYPGSISFENFR